jgi:hypothetical protein
MRQTDPPTESGALAKERREFRPAPNSPVKEKACLISLAHAAIATSAMRNRNITAPGAVSMSG